MSMKRLDMNHGFMKSIIKNQVERDKYEKEVQEEKRGQYSRGVVNKSVPKKDRIRNNRAKGSLVEDSSLGEHRKETEEELFLLEFEDANGSLHETLILKSDTPHSAAQRIAQNVNLPEDLIGALKVRLEMEFKRMKKCA